VTGEYETDVDGWVVCRFCRQPIERSGFADPITGGDGYWHRDGSDVCLTPQPARTLEEDQ